MFYSQMLCKHIDFTYISVTECDTRVKVWQVLYRALSQFITLGRPIVYGFE